MDKDCPVVNQVPTVCRDPTADGIQGITAEKRCDCPQGYKVNSNKDNCDVQPPGTVIPISIAADRTVTNTSHLSCLLMSEQFSHRPTAIDEQHPNFRLRERPVILF